MEKQGFSAAQGTNHGKPRRWKEVDICHQLMILVLGRRNGTIVCTAVHMESTMITRRVD